MLYSKLPPFKNCVCFCSFFPKPNSQYTLLHSIETGLKSYCKPDYFSIELVTIHGTIIVLHFKWNCISCEQRLPTGRLCVHYGLLWLNWHNITNFIVCACVCVWENNLFFFSHSVYTFVIIFFSGRFLFNLFTSTVVSFDSHIKRWREKKQLVSWCLYMME